MWSDLKANFSSAFVYLKEYPLLILPVIAVLIISVNDYKLLLLYIFAVLVFTFLLLNIVGHRRNKELDEIKTIINNIRKNKYEAAEEIILDKNLLTLQKAIKKMFKKTKSDIDHLHKLQKMRSQFLANVSHELRTPIFTIQGYIETLLNGAMNDPKVNTQFLSKANQHTINLSNLLNDLIDISMIESGEMRMNYNYFNLKEFFNQIVQEKKPLADKKKVMLHCTAPPEDLQVFGDKDKLKQVMINLVENAIKYTDEGSVNIYSKEENKKVTIIVKDTGIGIPNEDTSRIFERFYRVDKARSREVGGTGLGLAIVKHIIEAHGSKIAVSSVVNGGSEFSFTLRK